MKVTRRDLLVWSAGAAAGLMATPVPWKILDDVSIWSQNWPWIPQPAKGPVETKSSFCNLCPNGCGVQVRMAAGWPVGISGMKSHPISRGALCPLGFGAHQLNWHPQRVRTVSHGGKPSTWSEARTAFAKATGEGPLVLIDGYPGRAASSFLKTLAQKQHGSYRVVHGAETRSLAPYEAWSGVPASALGYDVENANTIVSFGAPLLDGWGTPGRFARLWAERAAGAKDPQLRLIQVDSSLSRTAARAWQWIAIREGAESDLAAGLASALFEQKLVPAHSPIPSMTLPEAAERSGVSTDTIRDLARTIATHLPALAISRDYSPTIAALNVVLGAVGTNGGIIRKSKNAELSAAAESTFADARAVLIDSSVPWNYVPQTKGEVFRFAAWDGSSSKADWLLPAPGFLEELTDVPSAPTSAVDTYAVARPMAQATCEVKSAAEFLENMDSSLTPVEQIIHQRCESIFRDGKGTLYGQQTVPVTKLASGQALEEQLSKGAVWVGEPAKLSSLHCELKEWPASEPAARVENWATMWPEPVLPPLSSKLYIESTLREAPEKRNA